MTNNLKPILRNSVSSHPKNETKKVGFDSVEIKYHKYILGDNPAVSDGAPISIGWKAHDHEIVNVDCYEATRASTKNKKKSKPPRLAVHHRAKILLKSGYSVGQLADMTQQVQEVQRQRAESSENQKWDRLNEFAESSGKIFKRLSRLNVGNTTNVINNPAA
jgi:hypothetical protein